MFVDWTQEDSDEILKENLEYYQEMLETNKHIAVFAKVEDKIVGCGGLCIYREMPSPDGTVNSFSQILF
ncbi:MAG: hypothetical protein Q4B22_08955 [Eubacteriales bacterium]|nr:hypothetical protein [Eubacteriales bacterium]